MYKYEPSVKILRVLLDSHCHGPAYTPISEALDELEQRRAADRIVAERAARVASQREEYLQQASDLRRTTARKDAALKLAVETLEYHAGMNVSLGPCALWDRMDHETIAACRAALEGK